MKVNGGSRMPDRAEVILFAFRTAASVESLAAIELSITICHRLSAVHEDL
jgi:hypothetical protein